ncbi:MAG: chemotaxis protein CheA [Verrucomicrobia bacterium]|nr:chemotaxis protein CheA [Verrucomicrobiota bacterium]
MSITSVSLATLDDVISRLAGESILAQPGRDEGLIPAYSLLGELCELSAPEPTLNGPATALRTELEKLLDSAKPFDDASLAYLRSTVEWLPKALAAAKAGQPIPACKASLVPVAASAPIAAVAAPVLDDGLEAKDVLLDLNLEENRELLTEFHAEAIDHLQQIEAALLVLDEQPGDPEALNSIFRSFHTIKGVSGFLHLTPMHTLTHEVESLLDLARNHKLRLNSPIITEILKSRDAVQAMVQQITAALESGTLPTQVIRVSQLMRAVKRLAVPDAEKTDTATPANSAAASVSVQAENHAPDPRSPSLHFDETSAPDEATHSAPPESVAQAQKAPDAKVAATQGKTGSSSTVRVNTDKLDSLMDVVGELVIVQSQLNESARVLGIENSPLQRNISQFGRLTKELQHTAMSLRMIPIKPTFQKMERLARDLSRDFGKKVNFGVTGEDTELDRTVVEDIGDPLVHMVRNSLDHGLETTAQRIDAGKSEHGNVTLKAYHEGGNIVIELSDDGRGINPDKILAKAKKQGLVSENAQLSKEEILNLIFLPGFSTAEKVTAVSGRGVGMDVVRRNIEKLRGKIEIDSEVGRGSTFRIRLPLTMAIIDGLIVRVGEDRFILPSTSVQMALRPTRDALCTIHGSGEVLDHRGKILPVHRLHRRFGIAGAIENPWEAIIVIVENNGRAHALLVDDMVSKQEVVIKPLGGFLQSLAGISGGAILGDGNIALILDPGSLFQAA